MLKFFIVSTLYWSDPLFITFLSILLQIFFNKMCLAKCLLTIWQNYVNLKKITNFCETKYFVGGKELFTISLIPIWREIVSMFCRVNRQGVKRVMRVKRVILRHARSFFSDYSAPTSGSGSLFTKRGVHNNHTSVPSMVPSTPHLSLYPPSSPWGGGGGGGGGLNVNMKIRRWRKSLYTF